MRKTQKLRRNEEGLASLVIALVLILVLSLLTVGFAQLARREQQSALDKQLGVQAAYAAETGINDTVHNLASIPDTNDASQCLDLTTMAAGTHPSSQVKGNGGLDLGVSYTCVLVDKQPLTLSKNLGVGSAWDLTFSTIGAAAPLDSITVNWCHDQNSSCVAKHPRNAGDTSLPPTGDWDSPAVLQFSLTPLVAADRASLINNTFTTYLYPSKTVTNCATNSCVTYATDNSSQGSITSGGCDNSGDCTVTINGLSGAAPAGGTYLVHMLDYYDSAHITISQAITQTGQKLRFDKAQAHIDVTGKARNVLKRLAVDVPLSNTSGPADTPEPNYAIQGQNICKREQTGATDPVNNPNGTSYVLPGGSGYTDMAPCSFNGTLSP